MTTVRYAFGDEILIEASGHCEDSEVCSCISTLAAALEGWLANSDVEYEYREADGYCEFLMSGGRECAMMFIVGCLRLEKMFPGLVRVEEGRGWEV